MVKLHTAVTCLGRSSSLKVKEKKYFFSQWKNYYMFSARNTVVKDTKICSNGINPISILAGFTFCLGFNMSLSEHFSNSSGGRLPLSSHPLPVVLWDHQNPVHFPAVGTVPACPAGHYKSSQLTHLWGPEASPAGTEWIMLRAQFSSSPGGLGVVRAALC